MRWPQVEFKDVAIIVTGNTPSKKVPENYGQGIPWAKPPNLGVYEPITETDEMLSETGQKKARVLPENTVMVCCIGSVGEVGISGTELATNQQINSLVFDPKLVLPRFGYYYCLSSKARFQNLASKAVVPILNKRNFSKITMPVPPPTEQQKIVELLDQADALRKRRIELNAKAERILPALFYKMFGDPVTNPMGWETKPLKALGKVVTGNTPSKKQPEYYGEDVPWCKPSDLDAGMVYSTKECLSAEGAEKARVLPELSTMVCCIGTIGKTGMAMVPMATNQQINSVSFTDEMDPCFGFQAIKLMSTVLENLAGSVTVKIVKKSLFESLVLPVPPIENQRRFSDIFSVIQKKLDFQNQSGEQLDQLWSSMLHRAFTGDLTAKWREAHMEELLQEMEIQAKALKLEVPA